MFKGINTKHELKKKRSTKELEKSQEFLENVFQILSEEVYHESEVRRRISTDNEIQESFRWNELSAADVFSINEIKNLCLTYRLRFLDSSMFKDEIPKEAIVKVKNIEKRLGRKVFNFKIAAPTERFELIDCEKDPLLFIQLSDKYYYLVHQWGEDLKWYRPMLVLPLRNRITLISAIVIASSFSTYLISFEHLFDLLNVSDTSVKLAFVAWTFVGVSALFSIARYLFLEGVSEKEWNNPYLKSRK